MSAPERPASSAAPAGHAASDRRVAPRPPRRLPSPLRLAVLTLVGLTLAFFALPLAGLAARTSWSELPARLASGPVRDALGLSLATSLAAAALSALFGLPLAGWLAGERTRARDAARVLVTLPMVLPPVVGGVALLLAFGRNGLVGAPLADWSGRSLPFTAAAVVLAQTWVAMPFFVVAAEAGLRSFDRRYAEAAASLGAGPWRAWRSVTLPLVLPSLRAGVVLAWARALGEFGATITFAGSLRGRTRTMPLEVFAALESRPEEAIALSVLFVSVCALCLWTLRARWFPR